MDNILKPNWVLMGANQAPLPHLEKQFASGHYTWLHLFRSFQKEMFSDEIWKLFSEYSKIDKTTVVPTLSIYHLGAYAIQATDKTNNLNRHLTETVARYAEFYNRPIANLFNIDADFGPSPEQANPAHIRTLLGENGLIVVHRIDQTAVEIASQSRWGRALDNAQYVRIGTIKHPRAVINNAAGKNYLQFLLGEADLHNQWKTEFRTEHRAEIVEQVACVEAVRDCSHVIDHLKKQILKLAATHNLTCETLKKHESYIEQKAAERTKAAQDKTGQSLLGQIIQNVQFFKEAQGQASAKSGAREWTPEEIEAYKNKERTRLQQNFANEFNSLAPLHNHSRSDISRWIEIDLRADPTSKEVDYVFNTCGEIIEGAKSLIEQSSNQPPAEAIASLEAFSKELQKKQATLTARRNELAEKNSLKAEKYEAWKEAWITKTEKAVTIAPGYIDFYVLKNTALKLGLIAKYGYWKLANTPLDIKDFLKLELPVAPRLQKANADQSEEQAKLDYANNVQTYRVDLQARINKALNEPTPERLIACVRTLQLEWKEPEPIEDLARFPKLDARLLQAPEVNITQKIRPTFNPAAALQIVLDRRTFLYNPVLGKNTAAKEALLDTPVIVAQGYDFVQTQLRNLDYKIEISSEIANRIERAKMRSQIAQAPNRELAGFECLAYYDYGMYVAQASVNDPEGNPVWIQGKQYLITPGWGNRTETLSEHSFNQGENADTGETGVEGSNAVTEIRHMSFQYSYWDVQTEGTPVRISETHDRAELEIENSLRKDPTIEPLSTAKGDTLEERAQNQEDENFRLRIELNPILDSNGQTIPPDETWKPCLDEFIQVFPPPSPMPVPLRYEEEIKALMAKAYKRFGSRYVNRAKAGLPLNAPESTLAEAKRLYEAEREAPGILWHELPDLDPQRVHDQAQASSNISHKVYADKAGYCDRAEGRLNEIKYYQLREAAIGAFKRSSLNNSVPGSGKAQPLNSKVLTPKGWKKMGEMQIGDTVCTPDGKTAQVNGIFPQGNVEIFTLHFEDGRSVEACGDHLWKVHSHTFENKDRIHAIKGHNQGYRLMTTRQMLAWTQKHTDGLSIPLVERLELENQYDGILPAYVLGALIGDGSLRGVGVGFTNEDDFILNKIRKLIKPLGYHLAPNSGNPANNQYYLTRINQDKHAPNTIAREIRKLGLNCGAKGKFIPEALFHTPHEFRLELLRGLMDTDGGVGLRGSLAYSTISPQLAKDVARLVHSLGGVAKIRPKQTYYTYLDRKKRGQPSFIINIRHNQPWTLVSLPRKGARLTNYQYEGNVRNKIEAIIPKGWEKAQCIHLNNEDHLYVTDSYVVTHNTLMTLMQCHMMDVKQAYVVTLTRLLKTWERECQRLKIPVFWIKGPTDALALKKKIEAHQKAGTRPAGTEIYLVSSEWLCLAGESNMQFLPWWGRHKLQEDYQKVFAFLGAWIKGMNTPESNEILKIMQDINERKHVTDQTYKDYETAKKEGIAWIRDPNRLQEQHGVNRDTFFKEKGEAVGCDRSWNIDVTELCNHSDKEDDPRAQIHLYLSAGTVDILSTRPDTRAAVEKSGLRVTRSIRYEVQHTKCPSCRREAPHWKGTHCRACGHDPRFYSIKPTAETVAERPPVVSGNDLEVWASKPVQVAYTDRGRKKLVIHEGNGRSNRAYPGYKLLPLVDALIVDEFHNFVSFRTLHGKAIFDVPAREILLTSGTLCRTRTSQAEPALALVHDANSPEFPYSRHAMGLFRERFATYETTTVINGKKTKKSKIEAPEASNANALRRLLHGRVVGVDEKTMETQWGLKKVNERVQKFAFSETEQEAYQKELNEVAEWRNALMEQIKTGDYETVKQARKLLLAGTKHQVNRLKALCNGISKVNAAVAWAKARHEAGERFVMVCKSVKLWQDVRKALKNEGIPIETIDEKITTEERDPVLTEWAAGTKNLLTRIKLVAEGFNQMVCCNWILFLELEDAPGYNRQMQKRLNRIGQTKDVFCDFLIGEMTGQKKTIDEAALANFIRREKALEEITSRTARYRGPAALLDEFQAQQGLLHVLEDATSNTMSELATNNQIVDINDWNEPVAAEKSEEDKQADILKSFEAELLQSDLPAQATVPQPETPVLLEVAPEPAPAPKSKVEIPTAVALSPETKKEIADVIDQELPVNALFPILKNIRRSRITRKAGDPNQMELFSTE